MQGFQIEGSDLIMIRFEDGTFVQREHCNPPGYIQWIRHSNPDKKVVEIKVINETGVRYIAPNEELVKKDSKNPSSLF